MTFFRFVVLRAWPALVAVELLIAYRFGAPLADHVTPNTGGGGGGGMRPYSGTNLGAGGGSGIVVVRYPI